MKLIEQLGPMANRYGHEAAVDMLAKTGFDGLDISLFDDEQIQWLQDPSWRDRARRLREVAQSRGLSVVQAHAPFKFSYDDEVRYGEKIQPLVEKSFEFAAELGVRHIVVHPLHHLPHYGNEERLFDWNLEFYRTLAPAARQLDLQIAVENMWRRDEKRGCIVPSFCGTSQEHARFMDALGDGPFTACVDIGHAALVGEEPDRFLLAMGPRVGCLHVQDTDYRADLHVMPGMGKHDWPAICKALAQIGYPGDFTYECNRAYGNLGDPALFPYLARLAHAQGRRLIRMIEQFSSQEA